MAECIAYGCAECHFPIDDFCGSLSAPYRQISDDGEIVWTTTHYQCQVDPGYGIDVSELRTYERILWWTGHLFAKTWFSRSTWEGFISLVLAGKETA